MRKNWRCGGESLLKNGTIDGYALLRAFCYVHTKSQSPRKYMQIYC